MNLIDLEAKGKLGKNTVYAFYKGSDEISVVISGSKEFVKNNVMDLLFLIDFACITAGKDGLAETTDTTYILESDE